MTPWGAYLHARDVVRGRWPEGEALISADRAAWRAYCNLVYARMPRHVGRRGSAGRGWTPRR